MVDAIDSKSIGRKAVWVRFPLRALYRITTMVDQCGYDVLIQKQTMTIWQQ